MTWFIEPGKYIKQTVDQNGTTSSEMVFYYYDDMPEQYKKTLMLNRRHGKSSLPYSMDLFNKAISSSLFLLLEVLFG